jgi:hypothetical protein
MEYKRQMKEDKEKRLKTYKQKMYKVGFGPNLNALLSEDSLSRYTYLEGAIEYVGEREITYIEEKDL